MVDPGALATGLLTGLREGLEAALIVSLVCAAVVRSGNVRFLRIVGLGAVAAVISSFAAGVALYLTIGGLPSPYEQAFEATAMLFAAGVVTAMLFWMRRRAAAVAGRLNRAVALAVSEGAAGGLAVVVFAAIIREGLEMALFLVGQARAATAADGGNGAVSVLLGALLGLAIAAGVGVALYRGSRRLDLARFFSWTAILLVFVAAGLVSAAVHELVEINVVRVATGVAFDLNGVLSEETGVGLVLRSVFGYSSRPEWIVLAAWAAYLLPVLFLLLRPVVRPARNAQPTAPAV